LPDRSDVAFAVFDNLGELAGAVVVGDAYHEYPALTAGFSR
jgi:hypothetical protein